MYRPRLAYLLLAATIATPTLRAADAPKPAATPQSTEKVKPIPPPPTKELTPDERKELESGVESLTKEIASLRTTLASKPDLLALIPDVQIYLNAVRYPLVYHEQIDLKSGKQAIADGLDRAKQLRAGSAPWLTAPVSPRGYLSKIDNSVQPYVLMVPASYKPGDTSKKYRLDFVEHGRNENLTELKMITTTKDHAVGGSPEKFVVLLYGRYCCANKFAGEVDLFEAYDAVKRQYPIDENRVLNIGFSMGGASAWQFATHYADVFAAASPGAGFAETREFLRMKPEEIDATPWYQKKLWHLYDCTDYAANLYNLPVVAYSGEIDGQKQSADIMEKYMAAEGLKLERVIGPKTGHAYEKNAKAQLDARLDELLAKGRDAWPKQVRLVTYTLRYNQMKWVTIDAMEKEWDQARVEAEVDGHAIKLKTKNVAKLTLTFGGPGSPIQPGDRVDVQLDDAKSSGFSDANGKWVGTYEKTPQGWQVAEIGKKDDGTLAKRHNLQGPIDDAFMDSFLIVKPTGQSPNEKVTAWANAECDHAIDHWRKQFRGEARVKNDADVSDADIADDNLVLFGDWRSNKILARIVDKLPIAWTEQRIKIGDKEFLADHHALIAIYPNPLNPKHYVVLNSGFTFREYDYLNNARQIPKLPDYAVIDLDTPITPRTPGTVVAAGFFGERWQLLPNDGQ